MRRKPEEKEKLNIDKTDSADISALVEESKERLKTADLKKNLDRMLAEKTRKLHELRKAHYEEKGGRKRSTQLRKEKAEAAAAGSEPGVTIADRRRLRKDRAGQLAYAAHVARMGLGEKSGPREGAFRRTIRLLAGLAELGKRFKGKSWYTNEKKKAAIREVFEDCWAPLTGGIASVLNTSWAFFLTVCYDLKELVLTVADTLIGAAYYLWSVIQLLWDCLWDIRYRLEAHKHTLFRMGAVLILSAAAVAFVYSSSIGYEYSYHGKTLGIARSKEDVYETLEIIGGKLSAATGANVSIDVESDIEFRQVVVGLDGDYDSKDDILNILTYMKDIQVQAYAISVNGVRQVIVESEAVAKAILSDIRDSYSLVRSGVEYTEISYNEKTEISEVSVKLGDIWNRDVAERYLKTGTTRAMATADDKPLLNVKTTELITYSEVIEYGTQYIDNASLYLGETELKSQGYTGSRLIVAEVERVNGEEVGREVVSSSVSTEPVDQVVYRGTKPLPERVGTGTFIYPLKTYVITSRFGIRWGRMHKGVDLAAPSGTKIYAADGGVVTHTGWNDSYGYYVIIDHGGLFETYYAHCSQILVSEGDKIYQGQNIALVGNTGNSRGPHVHFEVRFNGEPHDPLDYL